MPVAGCSYADLLRSLQSNLTKQNRPRRSVSVQLSWLMQSAAVQHLLRRLQSDLIGKNIYGAAFHCNSHACCRLQLCCTH